MSNEAYAQPQAEDWDARLKNPETAATLARLLDRSESLERLLDLADEAASQAPAVVAAVTDTLDRHAEQLSKSGAPLDDRAAAVLRALDRLTEPRTLDALTGMLSRLDRLERAMSTLDTIPHVLASLVDAFDDMHRRLARSGVDAEDLVAKLGKLGTQLAELVRSGSMDALLSSGLLDPEAIAVVGATGRALAASRQAPLKEAGPLDLLGALRNKNIRRSLGFLLEVGARLGDELAAEPDTAATAAKDQGPGKTS